MSKTTLFSLPVLALAIAGGAAFAQTPETPKSPEPSKFYKTGICRPGSRGRKSPQFPILFDPGGLRCARRRLDPCRIPRSDPRRRPGEPGQRQFPIHRCRREHRLPLHQGFPARDLTVRHSRDQQFAVGIRRARIGRNAAPAHHSSEQVEFLGRRPLSKPTVIFSSDDLMSKRQLQLQLTATPIQ